MNDSDIEILLSSDSEHDKLTAEIFYKEKFIALLNQDDGGENLRIEFPAANVKEDRVLRQIDLATFERGVDLAKKRLINKIRE